MKTIAICLSIFISTQQLLAGEMCVNLFYEHQDVVYAQRNERMTKKYSQFKSLVSNPQKYFIMYSEKFQMQKKIDPANPYAFDFSEWGIPLFKEMQSLLVEKRMVLESHFEKMNSGKMSRYLNRKKIADLRLGLEYFDLLQKELAQHLQSGYVSYQTVFELSYFYSRAVGMFDISILKLLSAQEKLYLKVDVLTEGYENLTVRQEFDRYLNRNVVVFDKSTPIKTWEAASKPFVQALFNKDKLEILILPTVEPLDTDIFMHLLASEIYLIGVTTNPINADSYLRPGGLFMVHDYRHASFMYYRNKMYIDKHNLSREQVDKLSRMMSLYSEQLDHELQAMQDQDLATAIRFYLFNQHHDGGYDFHPSNYERNNAFHAPFILYVQLVLANQPREFKSMKDIGRARKWIEKFWLDRTAEEYRLLEEFKLENSK